MPGGVAIQRSISLPELPRQLAMLELSPAEIDWRPSLLDVSLYVGAVSKGCFDQSQSPDGVPWKPIKPRRRKRDRKATRFRPLYDTGKLFGSMTGKAGAIRELSSLSLTQGTNVEYAPFQNDGTRTIPARPFVGLTPKHADQIGAIIVDRIMRQYFGR